jgi:transcription elongation factor Elf1
LSIIIPTVQENNSNIDQELSSPDDFVVETVIESEEEEMAAWILYPKLKEQSSKPEVDSTPEEKVYNCCMCQNVYKEFEALKQHALEDHQKRRHIPKGNSKSFLRDWFDCNICSRKFDSQYLLKKHQTTFQNLMTCEVCGIMTTPSNAKPHLKSHDNDLVECRICNKMYKKVSSVFVFFFIFNYLIFDCNSRFILLNTN